MLLLLAASATALSAALMGLMNTSMMGKTKSGIVAMLT